MAKLKTLKEVSKATGVGLSTIRKYINEFAGLVPVEKGQRNALMFDANAIKALKIIREGYQASELASSSSRSFRLLEESQS